MSRIPLVPFLIIVTGHLTDKKDGLFAHSNQLRVVHSVPGHIRLDEDCYRILLRLRGGLENVAAETKTELAEEFFFNSTNISLRPSSGALSLAFDKLSEEELCGLIGNITEDGGIRVVISQRGEGWRKPSSGDEVLISYTSIVGSKSASASSKPRLIQLGQGLLPAGLEQALTTSFTRLSRGRVFLSPPYASPARGNNIDAGGGADGDGASPAAAAAAAAAAAYDVELHDWNDVWRSADGAVAFRGLGQPAAYAPPAGDGDRLLLRVSAHLM